MKLAPLVLVLTTLGLVLADAAPADARPRPRRGDWFEANKGFGLGLMIGAPTGLSGKYYLSSDRAIDFGVGGIRYYRNRDGLHLHADYLFHPVTLVKAEPFWMPLYMGIGGRVFDFDDDGDGNDRDDGTALGVRAPIGIALDFNNVPLDVFFEVAVVVDFLLDYRDSVGADLNGAVGVRYYFN